MDKVLIFIMCAAVVAAVRLGLEKLVPGRSSLFYRYTTRAVTGLMLIVWIVTMYGCNGRL